MHYFCHIIYMDRRIFYKMLWEKYKIQTILRIHVILHKSFENKRPLFLSRKTSATISNSNLNLS